MKTLLRLILFNSYLWLVLAFGALLLAWLARAGLGPLEVGLLALYAAAAVVVQRLLRPAPRRPAQFDSLAAFERALRGSRPTLLELYSTRCAVCLARRSELDQLERALGNRLQIVRVNVATPFGAQMVDHFGVVFTPSYLLFSSYGAKEEEFTFALDRSRVLYWLDQQTITP